MPTQSEYALEEALIAQLKGMEYTPVRIENEAEMLVNFKRQLEIHNQNITLTPTEFERILNHLNTGSIFERAKILRDRFVLKRDNEEKLWLTFLNCTDWCMNEFQVTHQMTMEGKRKNRYDVTLLINGLPLVQIELKRRGAELKVAFNQINRYQHNSYDAGAGLFQYVQLFIISNGVDTKYFSNNLKQSYKQTFFWTDKLNHRLSDLHEFSAEFLKPCHIAKMITHYTVLNETSQCLMILRPYQFYATEALVDKVKNNRLLAKINTRPFTVDNQTILSRGINIESKESNHKNPSRLVNASATVANRINRSRVKLSILACINKGDPLSAFPKNSLLIVIACSPPQA